MHLTTIRCERNEISTLRIRQQNTNKSLTATLDLLSRCSLDRYDVIAIQEPYIDFLGNACTNAHWYSIYPQSHYKEGQQRTRSMILVNKRIATESWSAIEVGSPDITAIKMETQTGEVIIYNIYCDCNHSESLAAMNRHLTVQQHSTTARRGGNQGGMIWLGDFNWHHPLWDEPRNAHLFKCTNLEAA